MSSKQELPVSYRPTKLTNFEFRIFQTMKDMGLANAKILIGCSGGLDSVALVYCLFRIAGRLDIELEIASLHHGPTKNLALRTGRTVALAKVRKLSRTLELPFHTVRSKVSLHSEEDLRNFRHEALRTIAEKQDFRFIALAHHADDLLETRLIRLIRGTGPQGLIAMRKLEANGIIRPFLGESRSEILAYATSRKLEWKEDPSNSELGPLRNWVRLAWLPALEAKRPGSSRALTRSLNNLTAISFDERRDEQVITTQGSLEKIQSINKKGYLQLGISERRKMLAASLLKMVSRDFTAAHIEEIRKRVELPRNLGQKRRSFKLLGLEWQVNAEQILVRRIKSGAEHHHKLPNS
jgi:tRNA(Ile)-lysidine synthase